MSCPSGYQCISGKCRDFHGAIKGECSSSISEHFSEDEKTVQKNNILINVLIYICVSIVIIFLIMACCKYFYGEWLYPLWSLLHYLNGM